jgi:hypothetical protein
MDVNRNLLWTLSICWTRKDGMEEVVKQVVILWWMQEIQVSPNCKQVACLKIAARVHDKKSLHFLMEP